MKRHWQRIVVEVILGILLEIAPASLDMWATVAEYMVKLSGERVSISKLFRGIEQHGERSFISNRSAFIAPLLVS